MRPDVDTAMHRVTTTRARLTGAPVTAAALQEVEDAFGVGYLIALQADAWLMERERVLRERLGDASHPMTLVELRAVTQEHRTYRRSISALRRELAGLGAGHKRPPVHSPQMLA